jgi:hypothetical protein
MSRSLRFRNADAYPKVPAWFREAAEPALRAAKARRS